MLVKKVKVPKQFNRHTVPVLLEVLGVDYKKVCNRMNQSDEFFKPCFEGTLEFYGTDGWEKERALTAFRELAREAEKKLSPAQKIFLGWVLWDVEQPSDRSKPFQPLKPWPEN